MAHPLATPIHAVAPVDACSGAHYFCETIDLTRPFPSDRPVTQPSWDFVWNRWLTTSFRGIGLDFVCPAMMQVGQGVRGHLALEGGWRVAVQGLCQLHTHVPPSAGTGDGEGPWVLGALWSLHPVSSIILTAFVHETVAYPVTWS